MTPSDGEKAASFDLSAHNRTGWGRVFAALVALAAEPCGSAAAAELEIVDIKAYVFLEHAGKWSDDLIGGPGLVNAPRGGAPGGDTATGLMIDLTFAADESASSKTRAATVDLTQTNRAGQPIITHKTFDNFVFGPDGVTHKAVFLEAATCMPIVIDVRAGKSKKSARLDFQCDVVRAPN